MINKDKLINKVKKFMAKKGVKEINLYELLELIQETEEQDK